ncbi:ubiquitin-like protein transferase [Fragilaria crotonensis]|nr:ubiquitin-like protein transferase [Fragilaria crotonensis]
MDAKFSRFTYIDPVACQQLLSANRDDLDRYARDLRHGPDLELIFVQMSQERVKNEINAALQELPEEQSLMERFSQNQAGVNQHIPEYLFSRVHQNLIDCKLMDGHSAGVDTYVGSAGFSSRPRGDSLGSEVHFQRARGESVGSEAMLQGSLVERREGIRSILSTFYQSVDGQLCFLSKFNMNCLAAEFSTNPPEDPIPTDASPTDLRKRSPLPDEIDGIVLEVETLNLTPDIRKRLPVFSHLPAFTDVLFVELDLNRILSKETKQAFRKEFEKRKQRRKNRAVAEKNIDQLQKRKEQQRIDELKARMQRIDLTDDFFHYELDPEHGAMTGDEFGPSIGAAEATRSPSLRPATDTALNFRAVVNTQSSIAMTQDAFPSLGASAFPNVVEVSPVPTPTPLWARSWNEINVAPKAVERTEVLRMAPPMGAEKGKKSKNKEKIVLFSTGGQRGGS